MISRVVSSRQARTCRIVRLKALASKNTRPAHQEGGLRRLLGSETRDELDGFLKDHGVVKGLPTIEDFKRELEDLRGLNYKRAQTNSLAFPIPILVLVGEELRESVDALHRIRPN